MAHNMQLMPLKASLINLLDLSAKDEEENLTGGGKTAPRHSTKKKSQPIWPRKLLRLEDACRTSDSNCTL